MVSATWILCALYKDEGRGRGENVNSMYLLRADRTAGDTALANDLMLKERYRYT